MTIIDMSTRRPLPDGLAAELAAAFKIAEMLRDSDDAETIAPPKPPAPTFTVVVNRDTLEAAMRAVVKCVPGKPSLPVLSCFRLRVSDGAFDLAGTNLEMGIVLRVATTATPESDGAVAIPARKLLDFVAALKKGDEVTLRQTGINAIAVEGRASRTRAEMRGFDATEFPVIPGDAKHLQIQDLLMQALKLDGAREAKEENQPQQNLTFPFPVAHVRAIWAQVGYAAARDDARPVFTGINVRVRTVSGDDDATREVEVVACDSFRFAAYAFVGDGLPSAEAWRKDVIIPASSWKVLAAVAPRDATLTFVAPANRNQVLFLSDGFAFVSNTLAGLFPRYESIIPKQTTTSVVVARADLADALKRAMMFAKDSAAVVTWKVTDDTLALRSVDEDGGAVEQDIAAHVAYDGTIFEDKPAGCEWDPAAGAQVFMLNGFYTRDFADACASHRVRVRMTGANQPLLFEPDWGEDGAYDGLGARVVYLQMPMHSTR